jgi:hypothetical protein
LSDAFWISYHLDDFVIYSNYYCGLPQLVLKLLRMWQSTVKTEKCWFHHWNYQLIHKEYTWGTIIPLGITSHPPDSNSSGGIPPRNIWSCMRNSQQKWFCQKLQHMDICRLATSKCVTYHFNSNNSWLRNSKCPLPRMTIFPNIMRKMKNKTIPNLLWTLYLPNEIKKDNKILWDNPFKKTQAKHVYNIVFSISKS